MNRFSRKMDLKLHQQPQQTVPPGNHIALWDKIVKIIKGLVSGTDLGSQAIKGLTGGVKELANFVEQTGNLFERAGETNQKGINLAIEIA